MALLLDKFLRLPPRELRSHAMRRTTQLLLVLVVAALFVPGLALAYGGPGSVISGIGAFLAAVAALLASLFGFVYFPLKRLYRRMKGDEPVDRETDSAKIDD